MLKSNVSLLNIIWKVDRKNVGIFDSAETVDLTDPSLHPPLITFPCSWPCMAELHLNRPCGQTHSATTGVALCVILVWEPTGLLPCPSDFRSCFLFLSVLPQMSIYICKHGRKVLKREKHNHGEWWQEPWVGNGPTFSGSFRVVIVKWKR